ncbi:Hypothetical protein BSM4216_0317 [Bacillus smithii]|jgi:hypothetical protein|nr:Hypothetical protein BSM4216_0317 [Bacillus smithii]
MKKESITTCTRIENDFGRYSGETEGGRHKRIWLRNFLILYSGSTADQ